MALEFQCEPGVTAPPSPHFGDGPLRFGQTFAPHMAQVTWTADQGWHDAVIKPYTPISLSPASTVFHYAQTIFEGLKAYRQANGRIVLFRPRDNAIRLNRSAERMAMPTIDVDDQIACLRTLVSLDRAYVPHTKGDTLYIRPTMIGDSETLGAHSAKRFHYFVILSPSGAYYPRGLAPTRLKVERHHVRAVKGGVGAAKTGGNYAASFKATEDALRDGFDQVVWLDGRHNRYVQEAGAMNIMFVVDDVLITGALDGAILPGITRDSVLRLARDQGMAVEERAIAIDEVVAWAHEGRLQEAFGTGTAAAIAPIGELVYGDQRIVPGDGSIGPVAQMMYDTLTGIQFGHLDDPYGWIVEVVAGDDT